MNGILNRRQFVVDLGFLAAGCPAIRVAKRPRVLESIRVAAIGFGGRGKDLINAVHGCSGVKLVALCDVDQRILRQQSADDSTLVRVQDYRRILDRNDVDIIVAATPNHWHTLMAVQAMQAGKHVYVEKPISHNLRESEIITQAAARFGKLVQCGYQNRSENALRNFFQRLHNGEFGRLQSVLGSCYRPRVAIGKLDQPLEIPAHLDYDLWLGPAREQPVFRPRLHYDWHWDFNTGNGDVGNQGPHEWDLIQWALGDPGKLPEKIQVAGNRFGWNDAGNTPNVLACRAELKGVEICFEVMNLSPCETPHENCPVGVVLETEQGKFVGGRGGGRFVYFDGKVVEFSQQQSGQRDATVEHMRNFFNAVANDNREALHADCRHAAISASWAHLANISYRLAEPSAIDGLESVFEQSKLSHSTLRRTMRSREIYNQENKLHDTLPWKLGPLIQFDNAVGKLVGLSAAAANPLVSRDYRAGFEPPVM